jgi:uncharacterized protein (DUF1697 family)
MPRYVALLRGVNIGPKKRIAMADLRALVEDLGHGAAKTLVNSGNVVFTVNRKKANATLAREIEVALREKHGLDVGVVVRSGAEMAKIVASNPFPEAAATPKLLHVSFLDRVPNGEKVAALQEVERGEDDFRMIGTEVYLSVPNGLSGAVFNVNGLDKALGVVATSRNWNTVTKLADMVAG